VTTLGSQIDDLSDTFNEEKSELLYGTESAVQRGVQFMQNVKKGMDLFGDKNGPSIIVEYDEYKNNYIDVKRRGGRIRLITEITKDNIHYCKVLMKIVDELRHLDGLVGGIAVSESEYMATTTLHRGQLLTQVFYSNATEVVKQGQYIFNTFWNKAVPAKQRIKEIDEGLKREFIETIQDANDAQGLIFDTIRSSSDEIQIIFSTSNAPYHYNHEAMLLNFLKEKMLISPNKRDNEIKIRIIIPETSSLNKEKIQKLLLVKDKEEGEENGAISIKCLSRAHMGNNKLTTLIVDNEFAITVELKDSNELNDQAIGLTTYSNSEATVLSYVSIFETLWTQAELDEQATGSSDEKIDR
jgi:two-component system, OmpR family, sensor histidine kinase VicK